MLAAAAFAQAPPGQIQPQAQIQPQTPMQLQTPATPQTQPQENPGTRPGFIDAFGHWITNSVTNWNDGVKGAGDVARDAANAAGTATRDTAGAVARLPGTRVIAEREICQTAPNGAPDCQTAAELICKRHGFGSGSSIDFQTAENCPPIALNRPNGEPPPPCVMQSYVTRALCQ
ncbi:MAG TPA: hypothetical protein VKX28_21680 [Xanthobacteraceae bacterium]|nr:hypothetical protein [Xanthobacteraceae bacterium]